MKNKRDPPLQGRHRAQSRRGPVLSERLGEHPLDRPLEYEKAIEKVMLSLLRDETQVYKKFAENDAFKRSVSDMVYALTQATPPPSALILIDPAHKYCDKRIVDMVVSKSLITRSGRSCH